MNAERILQYILEHLTDITLEEMASVFGYNPIYFAKIFRDHFGLPFGKFVLKLRLRNAAQFIFDGGEIAEAGTTAGYSHAPGFSNAFSKEFGVSPRDFKHKRLQVPDMPLKEDIAGHPLQMEYSLMKASVLRADSSIHSMAMTRTSLRKLLIRSIMARNRWSFRKEPSWSASGGAMRMAISCMPLAVFWKMTRKHSRKKKYLSFRDSAMPTSGSRMTAHRQSLQNISASSSHTSSKNGAI